MWWCWGCAAEPSDTAFGPIVQPFSKRGNLKERPFCFVILTSKKKFKFLIQTKIRLNDCLMVEIGGLSRAKQKSLNASEGDVDAGIAGLEPFACIGGQGVVA